MEVGLDQHFEPAFLLDQLDPVDPAQNNERLVCTVIYTAFCTFGGKMLSKCQNEIDHNLNETISSCNG